MSHSEHLSKQFDSDLEEVRSRVLQMGGLVEAYQEVARRMGIMNENEQPRPTGPTLVK